jgi:hypothetical protein
MVKNEGLTKVLKGLGVYVTTGRGDNKSTYTDPYIWTLLAMDMNPMLYAKVVIWLTDSLIFDRIEAGNNFTPMNSAISRIVDNPDYAEIARSINKKVFGQHKTGIRQEASSKELKQITDIEKFVTKITQHRLVTSEKEIIETINNY